MRGIMGISFLAACMISCAPIEERQVTSGPVMTSGAIERVKEREVVVVFPEDDIPRAKLLRGKVTFAGFTKEGLDDFRVIPEEGRKVIIPENRKYPAVDGFWWRGDRAKWFKIPDHAEAWVVSGSGEKPARFDSSVAREHFSVFWKTLPGLGWASRLRGGVSEPGFYPNAGRSRIGVAWPF
jgi:hypothetical protein